MIDMEPDTEPESRWMCLRLLWPQLIRPWRWSLALHNYRKLR